MKGYVLPILAAGCLTFAGFHLATSQQPNLPTEPPLTPARSPFRQQLAGLGIVESRTENIAVGSHVPGIVVQVFVKEGDRIPAGAALFELDTRQVLADLRVKESLLAIAQGQLTRLEALPRVEELPPVAAQIAEIQAQVRQKEDALGRSRRLQQSGAVAEQSLVADQQALEAARAQLARVEAEDRLLKAGAWLPDKELAQAAVRQAESQLQQTKTLWELHRVAAPSITTDSAEACQWEVLKVNVRPGESVGTASGQPLIVLGDTGSRHVRVDIDENDIPRFEPAAKAIGYVRGDNLRPYDLRFVRIQPYVVPKRSLSGDSAERVDTRVMQVIYELPSDTRDIYIGQQMDVFLELPEHPVEGRRAREG